jgi:hypothetical protein
VNNCYVFSHEAAPPRTGRQTEMIVLMLAVALFALVLGATTLITGPAGLILAAFVAGWLVLFAARSLRARRGAHHGSH